MSIYITTRDAAELMGLKERTLINWRNLGKGPKYSKTSSRCVRYNREDVLGYMADHQVIPDPSDDQRSNGSDES
jgi:predicted DNA-binding transcriptional regulator AlpA